MSNYSNFSDTELYCTGVGTDALAELVPMSITGTPTWNKTMVNNLYYTTIVQAHSDILRSINNVFKTKSVLGTSLLQFSTQ